MKKIIAVIIAALALISFAACQPSETSSSQIPTNEATAPPTSTPKLKNLSITTGLETDSEYTPVAIMIENSKLARPQTGLMQADVVYEALVESSITRFMAVFNDNIPKMVGPVRSSRIYFINMLHEWDTAPYIHMGGPSGSDRPSYIYGEESSFIKVRIDGVKGYPEYFWRTDNRKSPHNAYTNPQLLFEQGVYNYTPKAHDNFKFDSNIAYDGKTVDNINLPYNTKEADYVSYKYDPSADKFFRYTQGEKFITYSVDDNGKETEEQVAVQNIIVQYVNTYILEDDIKSRKNIDVIGEGKAEFYIGGKHLTGTWSRESAASLTQYKLDDGSALVLKPGNTWIHMHPSDAQVVTTYSE